jgi:hypothetical protein
LPKLSKTILHRIAQKNLDFAVGFALVSKMFVIFGKNFTNMRVERRKYSRFSFVQLAERETVFHAFVKIRVWETSVGGCFVEWFEDARLGDEFRLKMRLPNGNFVPLVCKIIYRFTGIGVGVKFLELTKFEQDLVAEIIKFEMRRQFKTEVEPFAPPEKFYEIFSAKTEAWLVDANKTNCR